MNEKLTLVRAFYLLLFGAFGMVIPFLAVFFKQQGLSGTEIGLLLTFHSLAGLLTAPFWGHVSDESRFELRYLSIAVGLAVLSALVMGSHAPLIVILAASIVMRISEDGIGPMIDGFAVGRIETTENSWGYGGIRVFGSLGWILAAHLAGAVADRVGTSALFNGYAIFLFMAAVLLFFLRKGFTFRSAETERNNISTKLRLISISGIIKKDRFLAGAMAALFLHGIFRQALFRFEPLYLDVMGLDLTGIGLAGAIPAVVELAAMPLAGRLAGVRGPKNLLILAFALNGFRTVLVMSAPFVGVILASRVLEGAGYAAQMIGTVALVSERVPKNHFKTILALLSVSLIHLVGMIGNPIAGLIFDNYGMLSLYALSLGGSLTALVIMLWAGKGK